MRVLVAGSGAVGASTAWNLARRGVDTLLVERRDDVCAGASRRAFGGVRQQFDDDAEIALARASLAFFTALPDGLFDPVGYLYLATDDASETSLRDRYETQRRLGVVCVWLDREGVSKAAPGIRVDDVRGGLFGPEDGLADPEAVTRHMIRRFVDAGGRVAVGTSIEDVASPGDRIVVACGSETPEVLGNLSRRGFLARREAPPIRPLVRSLAETGPVAADPRLPLVIEACDGFHFRTRGDALRLAMADSPPRWAGTCDPAPAPPDDFGRIPLERLMRRFPAARTTSLVRRWAGLYDVTPDARPIIDRLADDVWVAAGFSGHGFMTSPAVGAHLADWVAEGTRPSVFDGFVADRWNGAPPNTWPTLL